ncbi:MAG: hypothetical protein WCJ56_08865 [bacterium]
MRTGSLLRLLPAMLCLGVATIAFADWPSNWTSADIGKPAVAGSAKYEYPNMTVNGAGSDIWYNSDQFQYVYQPVKDDVSIITHVVRISDGHEWSKAGIMLRQSLDADAANVFVNVTRGNGISMQQRTKKGVGCTLFNNKSITTPVWLKLTRVDDVITAYSAKDGANWTKLDTCTIPMGTEIFAGLAVTSHDAGNVTTGVFDCLSVVNNGPVITANKKLLTGPGGIINFTAAEPVTWSASVDGCIDATTGIFTCPAAATIGNTITVKGTSKADATRKSTLKIYVVASLDYALSDKATIDLSNTKVDDWIVAKTGGEYYKKNLPKSLITHYTQSYRGPDEDKRGPEGGFNFTKAGTLAPGPDADQTAYKYSSSRWGGSTYFYNIAPADTTQRVLDAYLTTSADNRTISVDFINSVTGARTEGATTTMSKNDSLPRRLHLVYQLPAALAGTGVGQYDQVKLGCSGNSRWLCWSGTVLSRP